MDTPALSAQHLTHRYGEHPALRDVTLTVERGHFHALLGPNGSGKTTLFRILTTLLRPSEGNARVMGHDVTDDPDAVRRSIGVVFQHVALDDALSVRENLDVQAALYGLPRADARTRADALLAALDLDALASRRVKTLSGGEKRRADLARALVHRPALLLLDEPTTALDPTARRHFHDLLQKLRADDGVTILMATHLLDEADDAHAVTILHHGAVVAEGSPEALKGRLGKETLWIVPQPGGTLDHEVPVIEGGRATRVGNALRIDHARPADVLAQLATSRPGAMASATIRTPTLDDVFFNATGQAYAAEPLSALT